MSKPFEIGDIIGCDRYKSTGASAGGLFVVVRLVHSEQLNTRVGATKFNRRGADTFGKTYAMFSAPGGPWYKFEDDLSDEDSRNYALAMLGLLIEDNNE